MLRGSEERFISVPDGEAGSIATLHRMAQLIRTPDPWVDDFTDILSQASEDPVELARLVFEWVRAKMLYTPDRNDSDILDELREPGYLLREIDTYGAAMGDCDDYVILYGALYHRLGYPFTMEAISRHEDLMLDHVYGAVYVNGVRIPVDGIVEFPFGWEVPAEEVTKRLSLSV